MNSSDLLECFINIENILVTMDLLVIGFLIIAFGLILASTILTASSFLRLIVKIFGYMPKEKALKIWLIIVGFYLSSEIFLGYGLELLFTHLDLGVPVTILILDFIDAAFVFYGVVSTLMETVPMLPLIGDQKTSAFSLSVGLYLFFVLGWLFVYSWFPQTSGLIFQSIEVCGFIAAFFIFRSIS